MLARAEWPSVWALLRALKWWPGVGELVATMDLESRALFAEGVAPPPLMTGDDLVAMGLPPGPRLGQLLWTLYDLQLEKRISTRDEAASLARKMWNEFLSRDRG